MRPLPVFALVLALLAPACPARAQDEAASEDAPSRLSTSQTFSVTVENDFFGGGTDEHYTNGLRLTWVSEDLNKFADEVPEWMLPYVDLLPFLGGRERQHNISIALSQELYTPEDTQLEELIEDDRPYAALTAFTLGFISKDEDMLDAVETTLGMVGPAALGEETQNNFHKLINDDSAKGWDNQLENEPALMVSWQRIWRALDLDFGEGFGMDLLPHLGASLGNVYTGVQAGGEVRLGFHLPLDFGTALMNKGGGVSAPVGEDDPRLDSGVGFHLFAGTDGRWVVHNILLDGNTFEHSHNVDKLPLVADVYAGACLVLGPIKLTYTLVHRGDEFEGQSGGQTYGSLNLSLTF